MNSPAFSHRESSDGFVRYSERRFNALTRLVLPRSRNNRKNCLCEFSKPSLWKRRGGGRDRLTLRVERFRGCHQLNGTTFHPQVHPTKRFAGFKMQKFRTAREQGGLLVCGISRIYDNGLHMLFYFFFFFFV